MNIDALIDKYITSTDKALKHMKQTKDTIQLEEKAINEILTYIKAYLQDAKYYREQKKLETSLTSIAYCEGLIDALKLIGAIEFLPPL
jgi:hypothetical protein